MKEMTRAEFERMIEAICIIGISIPELHPCGDCGDWDDEKNVQTGCRGGCECQDWDWSCEQFARVNNIKIIS